MANGKFKKAEKVIVVTILKKSDLLNSVFLKLLKLKKSELAPKTLKNSELTQKTLKNRNYLKNTSFWRM